MDEHTAPLFSGTVTTRFRGPFESRGLVGLTLVRFLDNCLLEMKCSWIRFLTSSYVLTRGQVAE